MSNPGRLPEQITVEKLTKNHLSYPRNQLITKACASAGYNDKLGLGIKKIINGCRRAKIPVPKFIDEGAGFEVILKQSKQRLISQQVKKETSTNIIKLTKNESVVVKLIAQNSKISVTQMVAKSHLSLGGIQDILTRLKDRNFIKHRGPNYGGYWSIINQAVKQEFIQVVDVKKRKK